MVFEPTEEMKAAYCDAERIREDQLIYKSALIRPLADLALHATAAALEAEHAITCREFHYKCPVDRTKGDWLRLADEKLREVKR